MKTIRLFLTGMALSGVLIAGLYMLHAQDAATSLQSVSTAQTAGPDSIVQLTADSQGLDLIPPGALPQSGTFWMMMPNGFSAPYPCPPPGQLPTYSLGWGGEFLVDGTGGQVALTPWRQGRTAGATTVAGALALQASNVLGLIDMVQTVQLQQILSASPMKLSGMMKMDAIPQLGGGDDNGTNAYNPLDNTIPPPDYGTNLWIARFNVATNLATGVISNSAADIPYELQYTMDLIQPWQSAGWFAYGSELTNWTPFSVPAIGSSNMFIRVRSWQDGGSGLPLWWQSQYFGTNGVDPYGDPAGDGWNNLQKFQLGLNPTNFYTPAAPQNVTMQVNNTSQQVTFSWQANQGNVSQYEIDKSGSAIGYVSASQTTFSTTLNPDFYGTEFVAPTFTVKALYSNGYASAKTSLSQELSQLANPVQIIRNFLGQYELLAGNLPSGATTIHLFWPTNFNFFAHTEQSSYYDVPVSSLVNGTYVLPDGLIESNASALYGSTPLVEILRQSGQFDWEAFAQMGAASAPFLDGRAQLKQNLIFLLRAATVDAPFNYVEYGNYRNPNYYYDYATFTNPPNYAYSGFYQLDEIANNDTYGWIESPGSFDPYWPFKATGATATSFSIHQNWTATGAHSQEREETMSIRTWEDQFTSIPAA